jgi:myosin heavy subunit
MTIDKTIFDLRFGSNENISPTRDELRVFLDSPKKEGRKELHGDDLAKYDELLDRVQDFAQQLRQNSTSADVRPRMFYGVLGHSHFAHPSLKLAVEQYHYHAHALRTLDLRKPAAFIRSAEEELKKLNTSRKEDAVKAGRLQDMVDERKKTLEALRKQREALTAELDHITRYIRDNLHKIEKLCETSDVLLKDPETAKKAAHHAIEDVKAQFKDQLKDALHHGAVTKEQLQAAKEDVAQLSKELTDLVREDVSSLARLYEAVGGHVRKFGGELDALLARTGGGRNSSLEEDQELFTKAGQVLVSLVSDHHFDLHAAKIPAGTAHEDLLAEKRRETLDLLREQLEKDRRAWSDRRSGKDRRTFADPDHPKPDRRAGKERRSGRGRR